MKDAINPDHYKSECSLECYQAMILALGVEGFVNFCLGNAFKYMWRYKNKGKPKEDLEKANWYLNKVIFHGTDNDKLVNKAVEMKDLLSSLYSISITLYGFEEKQKVCCTNNLNNKDDKETDKNDEKDWDDIYNILVKYINYCGMYTSEEIWRALEIAGRHCGRDS